MNTFEQQYQQRMQQRTDLFGVPGFVTYSAENSAIRVDAAASSFFMDAVHAWERNYDRVVPDGAIRPDKTASDEVHDDPKALFVTEPGLAVAALEHKYVISREADRSRASSLLGQLGMAIAAQNKAEA